MAEVPIDGMREDTIENTVYRLNVLTATGAVSADIGGDKNLAGVEGTEFQKISSASCATAPSLVRTRWQKPTQ